MHSDRGASFMSQELKRYLTERGIASSKTTLYHPTGNAQCERINQTIWRTVKLLLRIDKESENCWEAAFPEALHAVCSLLCTATNATPHERFLEFNRRSTSGRALPSFFIQPRPVLLRQFIRSKSDPLVEEVELLDANSSFSHVCFANGRESTVSTGDLAPKPADDSKVTNVRQTITTDPETENRELSNPCTNNSESLPNHASNSSPTLPEPLTPTEPTALRRSTGTRKAPQRYGNNIYDS